MAAPSRRRGAPGPAVFVLRHPTTFQRLRRDVPVPPDLTRIKFHSTLDLQQDDSGRPNNANQHALDHHPAWNPRGEHAHHGSRGAPLPARPVRNPVSGISGAVAACGRDPASLIPAVGAKGNYFFSFTSTLAIVFAHSS